MIREDFRHMRIIGLQINHLASPLGYSLDSPRLSWRYDGLRPGDGTRVSQARITVARTREDLLEDSEEDLLEDSGWKADLDPRATPLTMALDWRDRYWWRVQVRTDTGRVISSDPAWFETGVMEDEWAARWITTGQTDEPGDRLPIFSKRLRLQEKPDQIERARIYASSPGRIAVRVNGEAVDQGLMDPGDQTTDAWLQTDTYDITAQLAGPNAEGKQVLEPRVSILMGNGFYRSGSFDAPSHPWDLIAEVQIWYRDGQHQTIGTDESWQVTRSTIVSDPLTGSEKRDDTLADVAAVPAKINQQNHALLYDRMTPPVTARELGAAKVIDGPDDSALLVDARRLLSGSFRFHSALPSGARVTLRFASTEGSAEEEARKSVDPSAGPVADPPSPTNAASASAASAIYAFVSDGHEKDVRPAFAVYGYRWIILTGRDAGGKALSASDLRPIAQTLVPRAYGSALPGKGNLRVQASDSAAGKAVEDFVRRSQEAIDADLLTDPVSAPSRAERRHWTGDAQALAPAVLRTRDASQLYASYLYELRAIQERLQGRVPLAAPNGGEGLGALDSAGWSDAAVLLPWELYRATGDREQLRAAWPLMSAWADWSQAHQGDDRPQMGDWLAGDDLSNGMAGLRGKTPAAFLQAAFRVRVLDLLVRICRILGSEDLDRQADGEKYAGWAKGAREALRRDWFDDSGLCEAGTQTGFIVALALGFGDEARNAEALEDSLKKAGLTAGFIGQSLLASALEKAGKGEILRNLLFEGKLPDLFGSPAKALQPMPTYGLLEWFLDSVAGIQQSRDSAGYRQVVLRPRISRRLGSLAIGFRLPGGVWKLAWKVEGPKDPAAQIHVEAIVPFDASADLVLPCSGEGGPRHLGPGRHVYDYAAAEPIPR